MVTLRLRFVVSDRDRHGNVRYYFRRKGEKKVRLHGIPGSKEFMDAYDRALSPKNPLGSATVRSFGKGSLGFAKPTTRVQFSKNWTLKPNPGVAGYWRRFAANTVPTRLPDYRHVMCENFEIKSRSSRARRMRG